MLFEVARFDRAGCMLACCARQWGVADIQRKTAREPSCAAVVQTVNNSLTFSGTLTYAI